LYLLLAAAVEGETGEAEAKNSERAGFGNGHRRGVDLPIADSGVEAFDS
jgi:hypothetical protein